MLIRYIILFLFSIFLVGNTNAKGPSMCHTVRVKIINKTNYDCTLQNHLLINGTLVKNGSLPYLIPKGQNSFLDMPAGDYHVGSFLEYQCGEESSIKLFTLRLDRYSDYDFAYNAQDAINIKAKAKRARVQCDAWGPPAFNMLTWTLSEQQ
jgi:hypothetical protein